MRQDLLREAKLRAAKRKITFTRLIEDAVSFYPAAPVHRPGGSIGPLPTFGDPARPISEDQYRQAIEELDQEQILRIIRGFR